MDLSGFALLAALLVAIPGPAVTLVMKQSLMQGRGAALRTALGVFTADLFWVIASVVGLTAVIVASQPVFQAIRILGALYLGWLGITLLFRRREGGADELDTAEHNESPPPRRLGPFAEGALCDLSNPKTLLVFTSVIPQFLPTDGGHPLQAAVLGITFAVLGLGSLIVYAYVFGRVGLSGLRSRTADAILRLGGGVLVVFGVRLAIEPAD